MIRFISVSAIACAALSLPALADTQSYSETGFTKLSAAAGVDVSFSTGRDFSITAYNRNGDFEDLIIEREGDTLLVYRKSNYGWSWWNQRENYKVTVTAPSLNSVKASSGSDVEGSGLKGSQISIRSSSGSDIVIKGISGGDVDLKSSSGSDIKVSGTCETADIKSSSGSDINARGLQCETVYAKASSGSDISAYASETLTAKASSGADIDVRGNPTQTAELDKSSGGSISIR